MNDKSWRILIADDEPEIHTITRLVLSQETIMGRNLEFLSAMNGTDARKILQDNDDIALILLDVVMSSDNDGLDVAKWIREELGNKLVRIVLRTGNPGEAPEMEVISGYDINDYKEKAELTSKKLRTLIYTSLRNYRDLAILERSRKGLERIVSSLADLYIHSSLENFIAGVLEQICSHLFLEKGAMYGISSGLGAFRDIDEEDYRVVAATGSFANGERTSLWKMLPEDIRRMSSECAPGEDCFIKDDILLKRIDVHEHEKAILVLSGIGSLKDEDLNLLDIFVKNAALAFKNIAMRSTSSETES